MLDLNFVRDNLALVEEKLRQRGMNPADVLRDFQAIDAERRHAITQMETLKAKRNKAPKKSPRLKKSGQDASAQIAGNQELREQITELEKKSADADARLREILTWLPNLPHDGVPIGKSEADNVEARRWGASEVSISSPSRIGNWASI
jgi:seryl-tRNA synthetase